MSNNAGKRGVYVGRVAVDSGQVMIVDPCYILPREDGSRSDAAEGFTYADACAATLSDAGAGGFGRFPGNPGFGTPAVASGSGYGDGVYPVTADYDDNGRVIRLTIAFD